MLTAFLKLLETKLIQLGFVQVTASILSQLIMYASLCVILTLAFFCLKFVTTKAARIKTGQTKNKWDDVLLSASFVRLIPYLILFLSIYRLSPELLKSLPWFASFMTIAGGVGLAFTALFSAHALLNNITKSFADDSKSSRSVLIKLGADLSRIVAFVYFILFIVALLTGVKMLSILTFLGTFTLLIAWILRNPIDGLIAGLQVTSTGMVQVGDAVSFEKFKADGIVKNIQLFTTEVLNYDGSTTFFPTAQLLTESVMIYRLEGRLIKESVAIKVEPRFCEVAHVWQKFIDARLTSAQHPPFKGSAVTNIDVLIAYLKLYLENHPMVDNSRTFIVRVKETTEECVILQLYAFAKTNVWQEFEAVSAEIALHAKAASQHLI